MQQITRFIEIDAAHRVPLHGSKCKNLHGHRYRVEMCIRGELATEGEQTGMVLDYGFMKELLMRFVDAHCDHALILSVDDPFLVSLVEKAADFDLIHESVRKFKSWTGSLPTGRAHVIPYVPTAENLAMHWYNMLAERVSLRSDNRAKLLYILVNETPNTSALYMGE